MIEIDTEIHFYFLKNDYCCRNISITELVFVFTGFRFAPVISTVDEEVESQHLRFLAVPPGRTVCDILNGNCIKIRAYTVYMYARVGTPLYGLYRYVRPQMVHVDGRCDGICTRAFASP